MAEADVPVESWHLSRDRCKPKATVLPLAIRNAPMISEPKNHNICCRHGAKVIETP